MCVDDKISADSNGTKELTPEQGKIKREHFLALAEQQAKLDKSEGDEGDEVDSADATMATLILPGG